MNETMQILHACAVRRWKKRGLTLGLVLVVAYLAYAAMRLVT